MSADKTSVLPKHKRNGLVAILAPVWGLFKVIVFLTVIAVVATQIFTPGLNFASSDPKPFRSAQPADWVEATANNPRRSMRTRITTHDYRTLQVDYFAPPNLKDSPIPLTIVVTGFMTPEWMIDKVRPQGYNAVVIYRSPRINRISGPMLPTAIQARNAQSLTDYWNIFATNPLNYAYNIHAGLHEAPGDLVDIARWGIENIKVDANRINIVGLGTGSLIAAAAADALQADGIPARTVALVYPPAELSSAITDNLLDWPKWSRNIAAKILKMTYFRLHLERHLPRISNTAKLLVIPENAFELATYAAEPAISLAGDKTTVERLNLNYNAYYTETNVNAARDVVGRWLVGQGAIQGY